MKKNLLVAAMGLALFGCNSSSNDKVENEVENKEFELSIAHINDTHSSFDEVKTSFVNDYLLQGKPVYTSFGGHPRLQEAANQYRELAEQEDRSMLFLHGGDAWQGSAYFMLNEGRMNADILSRMGLDAMAMGNHEFDLDNETLAEFINTVTFPVLGANMDVSEDIHLNGLSNLLPYTLFAFDGNNKEEVTLDTMPTDKPIVAVVGMVLEDMASISPKVGDVKFASEVETAQQVVDELKANGVTQVVLLTHIGLARDINIAQQVDGIDVIVGGHSHTLMGDFTNLGNGDNGEYAQLVQNPGGGVTCVVQSGEMAQAIGHANVVFDSNGNLKSCSGGNTLLSSDTFFSDSLRDSGSLLIGNKALQVEDFIEEQDNIAITQEDEALRQHIDIYYKPDLEEAYGNIITSVPELLVQERRPNDGVTDEHGSQVAPLVAESWLHWANQEENLAVTSFDSVDIALVAAGGVRNSLQMGDLYEGNISLELLPFANYMSVLELSGATIRTLIDDSVTMTLDDNEHAGKFPYTAGLRYTYNETIAQVNGVLESIEVRKIDDEGNVTWEDLEDNQTYTVTTTNYNANGNDHWDAIFDAQTISVERFDIALIDGQPISYAVDHLIQIENSRSAVYSDDQPDCDAVNVACNTDAQAMIDWLDTEINTLVEVEFPPVTLNLLEDRN
ncbi:bifunctional metallophosphatase/5'-nucleotidase [Vibrio sp. 10N.286.49.B3]|uniref:bifunctional metallophosphatase/5'-nucleotidase n=1 Tax=Vibrio sp. 10N.286.49.B3 TaxID=1880855 RepID=UPI000C834920|nr:bifunctional metallophosphatase/5'-nucleotidase [Vibrio sp. 10N.286.49.B3]PMH45035.1 bifunctional metallophosphatase/5'-nucleotidase [Vibrio sp. 10N.286.49.B3]